MRASYSLCQTTGEEALASRRASPAPFAPALGQEIGINAVRYGPGVLHVISNDIYLDITFASWTQQTGGGFSYTRSTPVEAPVPEPSSAALLIVGVVAWVGVVAARSTRKESIAVQAAPTTAAGR
jgi:hypothetical protein